MDRFKNKIVLVTGAGSGIGRSTAVRLDQEGATLIIADINEDQLNETKDMQRELVEKFKKLYRLRSKIKKNIIKQRK